MVFTSILYDERSLRQQANKLTLTSLLSLIEVALTEFCFEAMICFVTNFYK